MPMPDSFIQLIGAASSASVQNMNQRGMSMHQYEIMQQRQMSAQSYHKQLEYIALQALNARTKKRKRTNFSIKQELQNEIDEWLEGVLE